MGLAPMGTSGRGLSTGRRLIGGRALSLDSVGVAAADVAVDSAIVSASDSEWLAADGVIGGLSGVKSKTLTSMPTAVSSAFASKSPTLVMTEVVLSTYSPDGGPHTSGRGVGHHHRVLRHHHLGVVRLGVDDDVFARVDKLLNALEESSAGLRTASPG